MNVEFLIKILVVILLVLFFIIRNKFVRYYRKFSYRFIVKYIIIFLLLMFYFSNLIDFSIIKVDIYSRLFFGLFLIIFGYILFFLSHHELGRNWSSLIDKKISKNDRLIKTGPYKFIRHPFYTASIISLVGFGILTANLVIFLLSLIIILFFYIYKIPKEEKFLIDKFGKKYLEYMKTTGGFFPKIK